jgi:hypothetical protein
MPKSYFRFLYGDLDLGFIRRYSGSLTFLPARGMILDKLRYLMTEVCTTASPPKLNLHVVCTFDSTRVLLTNTGLLSLEITLKTPSGLRLGH